MLRIWVPFAGASVPITSTLGASMAYIGLLLVLVVNCVVLFFLSILAVGGDGSSDGVKTVWLFGYSWLAAFAFAALVLCIRGKASAGISLAASALPSAFVAGLVVIIGGRALGFHIG